MHLLFRRGHGRTRHFIIIVIRDNLDLEPSELNTFLGEGFLHRLIGIALDDKLPARLRHKFDADDQAVVINLQNALGFERL